MRAPRGWLAARSRWRTGLGVHVTQLLKKETEAETPERAGQGGGRGGEVSRSVFVLRAPPNWERRGAGAGARTWGGGARVGCEV